MSQEYNQYIKNTIGECSNRYLKTTVETINIISILKAHKEWQKEHYRPPLQMGELDESHTTGIFKTQQLNWYWYNMFMRTGYRPSKFIEREICPPPQCNTKRS